jgi:hypothetical protein
MSNRKCYLKLFYFLHENNLANVTAFLQKFVNGGPYHLQLSTLRDSLELAGVEFYVSLRDDFFILKTLKPFANEKGKNLHYFSVKFNNIDYYHVDQYVGSVDYSIPCRSPGKTAKTIFDKTL